MPCLVHTENRSRALPAGGFPFPVRAGWRNFAPLRGLLLGGFLAATGVASAASPEPPLEFSGVVSVAYERGRPLDAWNSTCLAVLATLEEWQGSGIRAAIATNPAPEDVRRTLQALAAGTSTSAVQVVYLGARHSRSGAWEFTRRSDGTRSWSELLPAPLSPHPMRLVLLDVCHAGAVVRQTAWQQRVGSAATLLASAPGEWTYEFDFSARQPIDLARRHPAAYLWLRQHLPPNWNQRLSNLGVAWVLAYRQTPQAPHTLEEWRLFFRRCEEEGARLRALVAADQASTISQDPPLAPAKEEGSASPAVPVR
jgi:hypothetical protein